MEPLVGLDLKNFQSFIETNLNLDPGLNVIVGPSNLGKSAAIRALKALVYNAPATGLVREGTKEFETTAWFADGQKVSLIKGKNKSEYYHNENVYAKSGANEAPDIIKQTWNIATPDGRQLCFAAQHEPPFLLAEPASAVAKVLGDLTNASMLMEAVQKANKLRTQALNDVKARRREADEAREEILTHAGLTARSKALQAAKQAYSTAQAAVSQWNDLNTLSKNYADLATERVELTKLTERSVSVEELSQKMIDAAQSLLLLQKMKTEHSNLKLKVKASQASIEMCKLNIQNVEAEVHQLLEDAGYCPMCQQKVE